MAISRISSGTDLAYSGTYQAGDLLVILAVNGTSSAVPLTPSGYTLISSAQQSANSFAMSTFYKFASSASEPFPSITSSTGSSWVIYRGVAATPFSGTGGQSGTGTSVSYSGIAAFKNPGTDWVLTFGASNNSAGNLGTKPPTASTLVVSATGSNYEASIFDTNTAVSSYSFNSKTLPASANWLTKTTELAAGTVVSVQPSSGSFFTMF